MRGRVLALEPPAKLSPERLFRILCDPERPRQGIDFRIAGAERIALEVRAPTSRELSCALDPHGAVDPVSQEAAQKRAIIAMTLWAGGRRAFGISEAVDELYAHEVEALHRAVLGALPTIAPSRHWSNMQAWYERLKTGAEHPQNLGIAVEMDMTRDVEHAWGVGTFHTDRPDRYYGRAIALLTEGQILAYFAGRSVAMRYQ